MMEETISLKDILSILRKRARMITLITLIAAALSSIVTFFILTPIYQASTQILVNQAQSDQPYVDINQVRSNIELVNTYNVIIKSPTILEKVIEELSLERSYDELNQQVDVSSAQNSQVIEIAVQDPDPSKAADIANTIATVFQNEIVEIMNVDNVSILSVAEVSDNPSPVKPNPTLNIAIAIVIGLMIGVGLAFLLEYFDNTIKTEHDIEKYLGLPVLGTIPTIEVDDTIATRNRRSRQLTVRGDTFEA